MFLQCVGNVLYFFFDLLQYIFRFLYVNCVIYLWYIKYIAHKTKCKPWCSFIHVEIILLISVFNALSTKYKKEQVQVVLLIFQIIAR